MTGVEAIDLEQWAERNVSQSDFPRLLICLICGTCQGVKRLEIPSGEHIFLSGLDGFVVCEAGNAFVPDGTSVLELSTEAEVTTKANRDYNKRSEDHNDRIDKLNTTFVFATPRRWSNAKNWEENKQEQRVWKSVRGLSSGDLAAWIDSAPWLIDAIRSLLYGGANFQIRTAQIMWEHYAATPGLVPFDEEFILHNRETQKSELQRWLNTRISSGDRIVRVSAPTKMEAHHFIAACIHTLEPLASLSLSNRVLFLKDANSLQLLRNIDDEHVIVIEKELYPNVQPFVTRSNCKTILVHEESSNSFQPLPKIPSIVIPPMSKDHIFKHLLRHGHNYVEARSACEQCGFDYARIRSNVFLC